MNVIYVQVKFFYIAEIHEIWLIFSESQFMIPQLWLCGYGIAMLTCDLKYT